MKHVTTQLSLAMNSDDQKDGDQRMIYYDETKAELVTKDVVKTLFDFKKIEDTEERMNLLSKLMDNIEEIIIEEDKEDLDVDELIPINGGSETDHGVALEMTEILSKQKSYQL